jgi:hypothetical protein
VFSDYPDDTGPTAVRIHFSGDSAMSNDPNANMQQLKQKEFMSLLPLTLEIAGLPKAEPGRHFTPEQMEVRTNTLRTAYKIARQFLLEVAK